MENQKLEDQIVTTQADVENLLLELFNKLKEKDFTEKQALMVIFKLGKK